MGQFTGDDWDFERPGNTNDFRVQRIMFGGGAGRLATFKRFERRFDESIHVVGVVRGCDDGDPCGAGEPDNGPCILLEHWRTEVFDDPQRYPLSLGRERVRALNGDLEARLHLWVQIEFDGVVSETLNGLLEENGVAVQIDIVLLFGGGDDVF